MNSYRQTEKLPKRKERLTARQTRDYQTNVSTGVQTKIIKARTLHERGNYRSAYDIARRQYNKNNNNNAARLEMAKNLIVDPATRDKGIKLLQKLCELKGHQNFAKIYLAQIDAIKNEYDKAENKLLDLVGKVDEVFLLRELMYLEIKRENYAAALKYFGRLIYADTNYILSSNFYKRTNFFLKYKLGILTASDIEENKGYTYSQILEYNEAEAIKHISENPKNHFTPATISNILSGAEQKIENSQLSRYGNVDKYIIKCDDDIIPSKLEVVTIPKTSKILTFYPVRTVKKN